MREGKKRAGKDGISALKSENASYFKALKASNIHHVVAAFGDHAHHLHSFLQDDVKKKEPHVIKAYALVEHHCIGFFYCITLPQALLYPSQPSWTFLKDPVEEMKANKRI